jgi:hypothetical protein
MDDLEHYRLNRRRMLAVTGGLAGLVTLAGISPALAAEGAASGRAAAAKGRDWLPGDHHIHSEFSVGYDESTTLN